MENQKSDDAATMARVTPPPTGSAIGRISLAIEVNGKPCFVVLPHDRLMLLVNLATSLSDSGKLPAIEAPEGFRFQCLPNDLNEPRGK